MILWVTWPNQQCHSTEGQWLVNQVKGQSHQAPGASIPGGLGEQSPTFLKVGGGLKDWLFQLIFGAWIVRRIREKRR